ncbi:MAG TPA: peptidoglycan DD-metalloendopeptidase family protein [Syntrophales bacterium]|nr:peptidoglycan DD-metalloendopeptidase family protein [Syntrophales bacterium]HOL60236.1 peptidoglycan DD-metalloendopeptidase family protein [Syntrophales bacterium]HPO36343.1 peptidoglycan DD-metalloendopeptidase family protein [Syntrophales bacterium]
MMFFRKAKKNRHHWWKPITIMFIPHSYPRFTVNVNISPAGFISLLVLLLITVIFTIVFAPHLVNLYYAKKQVNEEKNQLKEIYSTYVSLKKIESEFRHLLSQGSKEKILEQVDTSDAGSFDLTEVNKKIEESMQTVGAIKDFLRTQKDLYLATPKGLPVPGEITSPYGMRINPFTRKWEFHSGLDISAPAGTPVKATADGVVSFSGWGGPHGGNVVVIAHGFGYSTYYAHNQRIIVSLGQRVKRGEVIAYVGSTGTTTGSHCHYEIRCNGKILNPIQFAKEQS